MTTILDFVSVVVVDIMQFVDVVYRDAVLLVHASFVRVRVVLVQCLIRMLSYSFSFSSSSCCHSSDYANDFDESIECCTTDSIDDNRYKSNRESFLDDQIFDVDEDDCDV